MFERCTDQVRHVTVLSQEEARGAGDDAIRAEHLLLAVLVGGGVGQRVLEGLGIEPGRVRPVAASLASERADASALATIGIDLDEVRRRSRQITDCHVLLALLARDQAPAARLLRRLGVDPGDARSALEEAMAPV